MDLPFLRAGASGLDHCPIHSSITRQVVVRAPRPVGKVSSRWAEVGDPRTMDPGADLMLLHPDGSEEVLVLI